MIKTQSYLVRQKSEEVNSRNGINWNPGQCVTGVKVENDEQMQIWKLLSIYPRWNQLQDYCVW